MLLRVCLDDLILYGSICIVFIRVLKTCKILVKCVLISDLSSSNTDVLGIKTAQWDPLYMLMMQCCHESRPGNRFGIFTPLLGRGVRVDCVIGTRYATECFRAYCSEFVRPFCFQSFFYEMQYNFLMKHYFKIRK